MVTLDRFPGYIGYDGIIAIHADWPTYPSGIGWEIALRTLGNFPSDTTFFEIDDIDKCKLLININPINICDPFNYDYFQMALWHEDLLELKKKGYIEGVIGKSEYEYDLLKFENFKEELGDNLEEDENENIVLYTKDAYGNTRKTLHKKPMLETDDEDDFVYRDWAYISDGIKLTANGLQKLIEISQNIELSKELKNIVEPLLQIGKYDTAIRDASLLLESCIKNFHKIDLFGQKLISFHITDIIKRNNNFYSAAIKCYRGELRTIMKFIRNDFAHNFKVLTKEQYTMILFRINEIMNKFEEVITVYYK